MDINGVYPTRVPIAQNVKDELDGMVDQEVIEKQEAQTPWINSMINVVKLNGKLSICLYPKDLNKTSQR